MKHAGFVKTQPEVIYFESFITSDGLKMIVSVNGGQRDGQIFEGIISSLTCQENLLQHFDSLQDLMQYINKDENRMINIDQRYIRIVSMVNSRKSKQINIAQIQLIPIHTRMQLRHIIDRCNSEKSLKLSDIKPLMKDIAQILSQLLSQSKSLNSELEQNRNGGGQSKYLKSVIGGKSKSVSSIIDKNSEHEKFQNIKSQIQISNQIRQLQEGIQQQNEQFWKNVKSSVDLKISELNDKIVKVELENQQKIKKAITQQNELKKYVVDQIDNKVQEFSKLFATHSQMSSLYKKIDGLCEKKQQKNQWQQNKNENKKSQRYSKKIQKQEAVQEKKQDYIQEPIKNETVEIDSQCLCFNNVKIEGNRIIAKNKADIFGLKILNNSNLKKKSQFTVTFARMKVFGGIGIIDKDYKKQPQLNRMQNSLINQIRYWSDKDLRNGKQAKQNQGYGFTEQEKVTVSVDFNIATVQWKVNNNLRFKITNNLLKNKSIKWVPYIYLNSEGDIATLQVDEV